MWQKTVFQWPHGFTGMPVMTFGLQAGQAPLRIKTFEVWLEEGREGRMELEFAGDVQDQRALDFVNGMVRDLQPSGSSSCAFKFGLSFSEVPGEYLTYTVLRKSIQLLEACGIAVLPPRIFTEIFEGRDSECPSNPRHYGELLMAKLLGTRGGKK
jgi:hypothetical protein